jgi:hypothetical protein
MRMDYALLAFFFFFFFFSVCAFVDTFTLLHLYSLGCVELNSYTCGLLLLLSIVCS